MSSARVGTDGLANAIHDILADYSRATYMDIRAATDKTAKEVVKRTKEKAPVRKRASAKARYAPGSYKKAITSTVDADTAGHYSRIVHVNSPHYPLAHLLQNGHGGPHPARAYPHFVEDSETERIFEDNLTRELNS